MPPMISPVQPPRYWFAKPYADFVQRLRVASGFLLLITFAWFCRPSAASLIAGLPICLAGLSIRAWAAGHLAKNQELAMSGPYSFVRNPLYAGTLLIAAGIVIACRSAVLGVIAAVVFLFVYLPVIELEEQHLRSIFPSYASYAAQVCRLLPLSSINTGNRRFSWKLYRRNQEWKAALGFGAALLWILWRFWSASQTH
jgi:protein-S-isoprenylcysteine O-methyltransferase Ste14